MPGCAAVVVAFWATDCQETGLSKGTAQRALHGLPKNPAVITSGRVGGSSLNRDCFGRLNL